METVVVVAVLVVVLHKVIHFGTEQHMLLVGLMEEQVQAQVEVGHRG